ncbi:hypothetical protein BV25DRAFT_1777501, partial [Artomyces pyxidatus]
NIWVAAGDGDLARTTTDADRPPEALSPNAPDPFTYTPMHAAASYGQLEVLDYLISKGGDVDVPDGDGDTPLYTVENTDTARYLVEHGATVARRNREGVSPAEHLAEDFPEVARYLESLGGAAPAAPLQPSQYEQNAASEQLTAALMANVQEIMARAEAEGRDPEEELRQAVGRTVVEGMVAGYGMSGSGADDGRED